MLIDCELCTARERGVCGECVVTFLLDRPPGAIVIDVDEERALRALHRGGLTAASRYRADDGGTDAELPA